MTNLIGKHFNNSLCSQFRMAARTACEMRQGYETTSVGG